MREPMFDIFTGTSRKNAIWLDSVEGLSNARARMYDIAAQIPGEYFVCLIGSDAILAEVETFKNRDAAKAKTA
jgi:hypothetical protein